MSTFWIIVILVLGFIITFQIAKASEYVSVLHGEEKTRKQNNRINAFLLLAFLVAGMIGVYYCNEMLKGKLLGESASLQGEHIDTMINITLVITGIVFFLTQIILFWFAFKYQHSEKRKAFYYPHSTKLEVIWTVIPAVTLTVLVGFSLFYWFKITGEAPKNSIVVEITAKQFTWEFRYPGKDGIMGKKYFKEVNYVKNNPLGQLWDDAANHDDIYLTREMRTVVGKPLKLIINSKDVVHSVGLPHFRMKMDAVPGTPTTMWFTPKFTTKEMKDKYGPDFEYEIACVELCGTGHWTMKAILVVEKQFEYDLWLAAKKPQYLAANPDKDPANAVKTEPAIVSN